jgi:hypothetical protein
MRPVARMHLRTRPFTVNELAEAGHATSSRKVFETNQQDRSTELARHVPQKHRADPSSRPSRDDPARPGSVRHPVLQVEREGEESGCWKSYKGQGDAAVSASLRL